VEAIAGAATGRAGRAPMRSVLDGEPRPSGGRPSAEAASGSEGNAGPERGGVQEPRSAADDAGHLQGP
jgi:hypothetical protein